MLECDRIDVLEEINVKKTNGSRECIICRYWYFIKINVTFQPEVCTGCQDLVLKAINFNDFAIDTIKGSDYRIHFL